MISSIGFIQNNIDRQKLTKFIPDKKIKERLEYLDIPVVETESNDDRSLSTESDEKILASDSIVFGTPNTETISTLAFYVYNEDSIFCHHDLYVFSTIFDSSHIGNGLVALATFEPDVFVYDAFTNFPILPQKLLIGHEKSVTGIKNENGRLMTSSEDKTIIEWDLEKLDIKNRCSYDIPIDRFDFEENNLAFAVNDYLNINNESISVSGIIENIKINKKHVYVLSSDGNAIIYDMRNLSGPLFQKKIHEDAAIDIAFSNDRIVTCSMDHTVKVWSNPLEWNLIASYEKKSAVYSLGFDHNGRLFVGDDNDEITFLSIN